MGAVYDPHMRARLWRWLRGGSAGWRLVWNGVFAYRAPNGFDGVCHLRIFESGAWRKRAVVIAGQLTDQAGACSIVNADEWIAAQVQDSFFPDGRRFVYVEHHPETVTGRPEPTFDIVELKRGAGNRTSASASAQQQIVVVTEEGAETHALPEGPEEPTWGWTFRAVRRAALSVHRLDGSDVGLDLLPGQPSTGYQPRPSLRILPSRSRPGSMR